MEISWKIVWIQDHNQTRNGIYLRFLIQCPLQHPHPNNLVPMRSMAKAIAPVALAQYSAELRWLKNWFSAVHEPSILSLLVVHNNFRSIFFLAFFAIFVDICFRFILMYSPEVTTGKSHKQNWMCWHNNERSTTNNVPAPHPQLYSYHRNMYAACTRIRHTHTRHTYIIDINACLVRRITHTQPHRFNQTSMRNILGYDFHSKNVWLKLEFFDSSENSRLRWTKKWTNKLVHAINDFLPFPDFIYFWIFHEISGGTLLMCRKYRSLPWTIILSVKIPESNRMLFRMSGSEACRDLDFNRWFRYAFHEKIDFSSVFDVRKKLSE